MEVESNQNNQKEHNYWGKIINKEPSIFYVRKRTGLVGLEYGKKGVSIFQAGDIKLERFLPKDQHTQRKFLNFENWTNREPQ